MVSFSFTYQDTMPRIYFEWFQVANDESAMFLFTNIDEYDPRYTYSEIWILIKINYRTCELVK